MRPGKKGRSVARVLVAVAMAAAAVAGAALVKSETVKLADVVWTYTAGE